MAAHYTTVIEALQKKNIRYDNDSPTMLGIYLGKHCWHWFEKLTDGNIYFNHTYSQNTGRTKRGTMHRINIKRRISKKIGIEL